MEIEVEQVRQRNKVFYFCDFIMLEGEHFEFFFSLEERNMVEVEPIQIHFLNILISFDWPPIAHPYIGNLG